MGGAGTQPMISQAPDIQSTRVVEEDDWEEENPDAGLMPFAIIVLLLAIGLLVIEILTKMNSGV